MSIELGNLDRYENIMAAGWIKDLESSDSRIHKEKTIEKALMASNLGSADAQIFLYNCYQAYNAFYTFNVKQVPDTKRAHWSSQSLAQILGLVRRPAHTWHHW